MITLIALAVLLTCFNSRRMEQVGPPYDAGDHVFMAFGILVPFFIVFAGIIKWAPVVFNHISWSALGRLL